jgi:hypothetical protein
MWKTAGAGASVVTTTPHSGLNSLRITGTSGKSLQRDLATAVTTGHTLWTRFYWQTNTTAGNSSFFTNKSNAGTGALDLQKLSTGKLRLTNTPTGVTTDSTLTVSINTIYRIEVRQVLHASQGEVEAKIFVGDSLTASDDLQLGTLDLNTLPAAGNVTQFFLQEGAASGSITYLFDDVGINDESGAAFNTWLGPGKIALTYPSADTTVTWTKGGSAPAATNFQGIFDVPGTPDDSTTLNCDTTTCSAAATTNEDKLGIHTLPAEVTSDAVMTLIDIYGRVNVATAVSGTMALVTWDDAATRTQGPTMTVNSTTWRMLTTAEHQVSSLAGKTKANTESYAIGYKALSGTVAKQITALWANVEWLEAAGGGGATPRNLMLMGVGP